MEYGKLIEAILMKYIINKLNNVEIPIMSIEEKLWEYWENWNTDQEYRELVIRIWTSIADVDYETR